METNAIKRKTIGEGGYSKVRLIENKGIKLARKEIDITKQPIDVIKNEINILKGLSDRNILILKDYEIVEEKNICYIYTEYVENGDLWRIIDEKKKEGEDFTREVYIVDMYLLFIGNS